MADPQHDQSEGLDLLLNAISGGHRQPPPSHPSADPSHQQPSLNSSFAATTTADEDDDETDSGRALAYERDPPAGESEDSVAEDEGGLIWLPQQQQQQQQQPAPNRSAAAAVEGVPFFNPTEPPSDPGMGHLAGGEAVQIEPYDDRPTMTSGPAPAELSYAQALAAATRAYNDSGSEMDTRWDPSPAVAAASHLEGVQTSKRKGRPESDVAGTSTSTGLGPVVEVDRHLQQQQQHESYVHAAATSSSSAYMLHPAADDPIFQAQAQAQAQSAVEPHQAPMALTDESIRPMLEHVLERHLVLLPGSSGGGASSSDPPLFDASAAPAIVKLDLFYPLAAQKSYANEKRFLTPAPVVRLSIGELAGAFPAGDGEREGEGGKVVCELGLAVLSTAMDTPRGLAGGHLQHQQEGPQTTSKQRRRLNLDVHALGSGPSSGKDGGASSGHAAFDAVYIGGPPMNALPPTTAGGETSGAVSSTLGGPSSSTTTMADDVGLDSYAAVAAEAEDDSLDPTLRLHAPSASDIAPSAEEPPAVVAPRPKGKQKGKQPPGGAAGLCTWRLKVELAQFGAATAVGRGMSDGAGSAMAKGGQQAEAEGTRPRKRIKTSARTISTEAALLPPIPSTLLPVPNPLLTLVSQPLSIRSKPPKRSKTGKHRPPTAEGSLANGSTFFLHSRINKQTTRQGSLAVLPSAFMNATSVDDSGAEMRRLGVSTETEWSRWTIERVSRATAVDGGGNDEAADDDGWVWYGDEVILVEVQSGWRTEPLVLCRVEGKSVVFDESAGGGEQAQLPMLAFDEGELHPSGGGQAGTSSSAAAAAAAARNGGSVGQLSKVAFRRPASSIPPDAAADGSSSNSTPPRWYLSCAPNLDNPPAGSGGLGAEGRPVTFVSGESGASAGRDKVDDFSLFTIGSVCTASLTYFRFPPVPAPHLWPAPGPLPSIAAEPTIQPAFIHPDGHTLELTVADAYSQATVSSSGSTGGQDVLVELWAGSIGPLEVRRTNDDGQFAEDVFESAASGGQVGLVVGLPSAVDIAHILGRSANGGEGDHHHPPPHEASSSSVDFEAIDADVYQQQQQQQHESGEVQPQAGPSTAFDGHNGPTAALDGLQAVAAAMASIQEQEREAQQRQHQHQHQDDVGALIDPTLEHRLAAFAQQHQHQMHDPHEHESAAAAALEAPTYASEPTSPPIPAVYPPSATAPATGALPIIFVRRNRGDGVLSGLSLSVDEDGRLQLVNT